MTDYMDLIPPADRMLLIARDVNTIDNLRRRIRMVIVTEAEHGEMYVNMLLRGSEPSDVDLLRTELAGCGYKTTLLGNHLTIEWGREHDE